MVEKVSCSIITSITSRFSVSKTRLSLFRDETKMMINNTLRLAKYSSRKPNDRQTSLSVSLKKFRLNFDTTEQ